MYQLTIKYIHKDRCYGHEFMIAAAFPLASVIINVICLHSAFGYDHSHRDTVISGAAT